METIEQVLSSLGLSSYLQAFTNEQIDPHSLSLLSEEDLVGMGGGHGRTKEDTGVAEESGKRREGERRGETKRWREREDDYSLYFFFFLLYSF